MNAHSKALCLSEAVVCLSFCCTLLYSESLCADKSFSASPVCVFRPFCFTDLVATFDMFQVVPLFNKRVQLFPGCSFVLYQMPKTIPPCLVRLYLFVFNFLTESFSVTFVTEEAKWRWRGKSHFEHECFRCFQFWVVLMSNQRLDSSDRVNVRLISYPPLPLSFNNLLFVYYMQI